jgi:hypothetical protein
MPQNLERCPLVSYKRYAELRPSQYCGEDDPFYVAIKNKKPANDTQWYKKQPVGMNTIATFCPLMAKAAGIADGRKLTNTSYRKHMASRLNESHVPKDVGRHVTGHKQASSLDNYAPLSNKQQRLLSHIVGGDDVPFHLPVQFPEGQLRNRTIPAAVGHSEVQPTAAAEVRPDVPIVAVERREDEVMGSMPSSNTAVNASIRTGQHGYLYGANIHGGNFNFHIHQHHHYPAKRRRVNVIESDSDE